jgi:hypothetical protein
MSTAPTTTTTPLLDDLGKMAATIAVVVVIGYCSLMLAAYCMDGGG